MPAFTWRASARACWPRARSWGSVPCRSAGTCSTPSANLGRQFWAQQDGRDYWLAIGRTSADNQALHTVLGKDDAKIHLADIPGPLAVACGGRTWPEEVLRAAAALMASYSGKAVRLGAPVGVRASWLGGGWQGEVLPSREGIWQEPAWVPAREELRAEQKARLHGIPPQEEAGE